jgi:hypothetical protein
MVGDEGGKKGGKEDSGDTDGSKTSQNDSLAAAFPTPGTVSDNLGTLFSGVGQMPAVMEKNAALQAQAQAQAPLADPALAALFSAAPANGGNVLSVASLLRGYSTGPTSQSGRGAGASDVAPASPSNASVAAPAVPLSTNDSGNVAEKSVTLTSNTQFVDVIRQALDEQPMPTPQRIAVELQTPPGATVTVFFSQANGQLRAQLSASDSGSLHWLQEQVSGLREGGGNAGSVVWLPPQLDQQPGGGDSPAHQQSQQQPQRQAPPSAEDAALAESIFGGIETGTEAARN